MRQLVTELDLASLLEKYFSRHGSTAESALAHMRKVAELTRGIYAYACPDSSPRERWLAYMEGALHDIGKCGFDCELLQLQDNHKGEPSPRHRSQISGHPVLGFCVLRNEPEYELATSCQQAALYHHLNWNGTGYPDLVQKGGRIPQSGRLVRVADAFDAIITRQHHGSPPPSRVKAVEYMMADSGILYDPGYMDALRQYVLDGAPRL